MKHTLTFEVQTTRNKVLSSAIFECYKMIKFPMPMFIPMYKRYSIEYLARKYWLCVWKLENDPPKNHVGWLKNQIDEDHPVPEGFHAWWKPKQSEILKGEYSQAAKQCAGVV